MLRIRTVPDLPPPICVSTLTVWALTPGHALLNQIPILTPKLKPASAYINYKCSLKQALTLSCCTHLYPRLPCPYSWALQSFWQDVLDTKSYLGYSLAPLTCPVLKKMFLHIFEKINLYISLFSDVHWKKCVISHCHNDYLYKPSILRLKLIFYDNITGIFFFTCWSAYFE